MEINSEEKLSFLCLFHFVYFLTSLEFLDINEGLAVKNEQSGRGMSLNFIVAKMTRNIYVGRQRKIFTVECLTKILLKQSDLKYEYSLKVR